MSLKMARSAYRVTFVT